MTRQLSQQNLTRASNQLEDGAVASRQATIEEHPMRQKALQTVKGCLSRQPYVKVSHITAFRRVCARMAAN